MSDKIFVDTNVLVYAYDRSEPGKQQQARDIIAHLMQQDRGAISTQVLAEFFVAVTRRIDAPLTQEDAYLRIQNYLQYWPIIEITGFTVLEAVRGVRDYRLSFWDAQIWAAARLNQISVVFSEDFNSGSLLEGVRFVNPFESTFQREDWQ